MLEQKIVNKLSKELQIAPEFIVRETWEIIILKELFAKKWSEKLVFKGGTALRLAYQSPRFSVDLDFSVLAKINPKDFFSFLSALGKKYSELEIIDKKDKFYTLYAQIKIKEAFLNRPFSIKIEISKRKNQFKKNEHLPKVLKTLVYPIEVLCDTATLEKIYRDKITTIQNRQAPRDLFDLWYLSEKLNKSFRPPSTKLTKKNIKSELHKFLPLNYQKSVKFIISQINK
ncbi:MAG: nucleotidyl transferase AbiEii/AbiGii toxin family protein [Candidatus Pacebacteria bacterium]|nr:nucleotidyl transferase AbiEii/AbiGii toxin family protein [Candidatus Paceibacterota bacterium]